MSCLSNGSDVVSVFTIVVCCVCLPLVCCECLTVIDALNLSQFMGFFLGFFLFCFFFSFLVFVVVVIVGGGGAIAFMEVLIL